MNPYETRPDFVSLDHRSVPKRMLRKHSSLAHSLQYELELQENLFSRPSLPRTS
jgi:hypothetical protein